MISECMNDFQQGGGNWGEGQGLPEAHAQMGWYPFMEDRFEEFIV